MMGQCTCKTAFGPSCSFCEEAKRHDELAAERAAGRTESAAKWLLACRTILKEKHPELYSLVIAEAMKP